jgi:hypothetical protein
VAATFDLKDENDNAEAAQACARMRQIADGFGGVIVPIHHYGKSMESGLRGASAWRAGADTVIAVLAEIDPFTGDVDKRELAITKSRDGTTGALAVHTQIHRAWHHRVRQGIRDLLRRAGPQW